jgi:hypothetical protein
MEDTCVVITGVIDSSFVSPLINMYKDIPNKIISTWRYQSHINEFIENGFMVCLNDYPIHKNSTNYQTVNIRQGCIKAKELGFKYVIRMRTDLICNDMGLFMTVIEKFYKDKLTVLCGLQTTVFYYVDFFVAGPINEMLIFFNKEQETEDKRFVEQYWMEEYFNKSNITFDEFKQRINICLTDLRNNNIEMELISKNWGKIIGKYCNQDIILN